MHRILVVDDEPTIVEGIAELLKSTLTGDVDVYRALSGSEAMDAMYRSRMDVVVSDIRMPGLDGLELIKEVEARWPRCRVIMLSGYDSFDYIHRASQSPVFAAYVLKSDTDEELVSTVRRVLEQRAKELERERLETEARRRISELLPAMKRVFLADMVQGYLPEDVGQWGDISQLELAIDPHAPLLLILGHAQPASGFPHVFQHRWIATCEALVHRELSPQARVEHAMLFKGFVAILVQPRSDVRHSRPDDFFRYVRAGMHVVQEDLRRNDGIVASLAIGAGLHRRRDVPADLRTLWTLLEVFGGTPEGVVIDDHWLREVLDRETALPAIDRIDFTLHLHPLETILRQGTPEEFEREYLKAAGGADGRLRELTIEQQTSLLIVILSAAQELGLSQELSVDVADSRLWRPAVTDDPTRRTQWYLDLGRQICRLRLQRVGWGAEQVVRKIRDYVQDHIEDRNLSLLHVAEVSGYNPSYFSRLFFDQTGEHFSDYLSRARFEHACSLLGRPEMTVAEVTRRCGFGSASYFSQFFRKRTGVSPSRYQKEHSLREAVDGQDPE
jgi:two-component system, response regulator YesN